MTWPHVFGLYVMTRPKCWYSFGYGLWLCTTSRKGISIHAVVGILSGIVHVTTLSVHTLRAPTSWLSQWLCGKRMHSLRMELATHYAQTYIWQIFLRIHIVRSHSDSPRQVQGWFLNMKEQFSMLNWNVKSITFLSQLSILQPVFSAILLSFAQARISFCTS